MIYITTQNYMVSSVDRSLIACASATPKEVLSLMNFMCKNIRDYLCYNSIARIIAVMGSLLHCCTLLWGTCSSTTFRWLYCFYVFV